jgi:hypothetical protein
MAHRKHHKKKTTHRRRRVSGVNASNMVMGVAGVAAGAAIAGLLQSKVLASQKPMIQALVPIAAGVAIPMFVKHPIAQTAGYGMVAAGVINLLKQHGMAGYDDMLGEVIEIPINGTESIRSLGNATDLPYIPSLNGVPSYGGYPITE